MVLFVQKWLYSGKVVVIGKKLLYSKKVVVYGQSGFIRAKWLYSVKVGDVFGSEWLSS